MNCRAIFHGCYSAYAFAILQAFVCCASKAADYYYITNNGTITITWYYGPSGAVQIPSAINGLPVTAIGGEDIDFGGQWFHRGAFEGRAVTSVAVPNSVTTIGTRAFANCEYLTNLNIPRSVTTIGGSAFRNCYVLPSLTFPDSVMSIGAEALEACPSLTNVTFPAGLAELPYYLLSGCTSLSEVVIPHTVGTIDEGAFFSCSSLTNVHLGSGVTEIRAFAFADCSSLKTIILPRTLKTLGEGVFVNCFELEGAYFRGEAPSFDTNYPPFFGTNLPTAFYLPGANGWGTSFGGALTAPWYLPAPTILGFGSSFGVQTNAFGFRISWATNASLAIEARTNLTGSWVPLATNSLVGGWTDFSDPDWANHPARIYRVRSP